MAWEDLLRLAKKAASDCDCNCLVHSGRVALRQGLHNHGAQSGVALQVDKSRTLEFLTWILSRDKNHKISRESYDKIDEFQFEPQSPNRQNINLSKKLGFRQFQKERLKVCKTALLAQRVRFCTLSGVFFSGIGGLN